VDNILCRPGLPENYKYSFIFSSELLYFIVNFFKRNYAKLTTIGELIVANSEHGILKGGLANSGTSASL
jgi:hypothetical protein